MQTINEKTEEFREKGTGKDVVFQTSNNGVNVAFVN